MSPQNGVIVLTFLVSDLKMLFKKKVVCGFHVEKMMETFSKIWSVFSHCLQRELCDELMSWEQIINESLLIFQYLSIHNLRLSCDCTLPLSSARAPLVLLSVVWELCSSVLFMLLVLVRRSCVVSLWTLRLAVW